MSQIEQLINSVKRGDLTSVKSMWENGGIDDDYDAFSDALSKASKNGYLKITDGEWSMFCTKTKYKITKDYLCRVEAVVYLIRKYFYSYKIYDSEMIYPRKELLLSSEPSNIPDISKYFQSIDNVKIWAPYSTTGEYKWLQDIVSNSKELLSFMRKF